MKRGNVEIKELDGGYRVTVRRRMFGSAFWICEQDLKDLYHLIDTVLGYEKPYYWCAHTKETGCDCLSENVKEALKEATTDMDKQSVWDDFDSGCSRKPQESNKEDTRKTSITIGCMECGNNIKV